MSFSWDIFDTRCLVWRWCLLIYTRNFYDAMLNVSSYFTTVQYSIFAFVTIDRCIDERIKNKPSNKINPISYTCCGCWLSNAKMTWGRQSKSISFVNMHMHYPHPPTLHASIYNIILLLFVCLFVFSFVCNTVVLYFVIIEKCGCVYNSFRFVLFVYAGDVFFFIFSFVLMIDRWWWWWYYSSSKGALL